MVKWVKIPNNRFIITEKMVRELKIVIPKKTLNASLVPVCLIIPLYEPTDKKLPSAIIKTKGS